MAKHPLVSVVVTTKNEEKHITPCLQSIREQTYPNIEMIVVDNFSTDKTVEIARSYTEKVYLKGPERSAQRNYGMKEKAGGEYVMYVDADMILSPSLVEACVRWMEERHPVALHIPEIVLGSSFWSRVRRFERQFYDGTVIDGARFFHRGVFCEVGGFDERFSGPEDWDLDKKIKQKGRIDLLLSGENTLLAFSLWDFLKERGVFPPYSLCCVYHNESEFSFRRYLTKKSYYTMNFAPYIQKWGKDDPDIKKQFGFWYRYIGVFVEKGKWKRLLCHPFLALGMYVLRFCVGVIFLLKGHSFQGK
ncbi:MAG: glycosyltransferase [Brevinematales bacterium]|nr:glycosyltransferase [Brevinematales bacterium]